jgi:hypothetical protein
MKRWAPRHEAELIGAFVRGLYLTAARIFNLSFPRKRESSICSSTTLGSGVRGDDEINNGPMDSRFRGNDTGHTLTVIVLTMRLNRFVVSELYRHRRRLQLVAIAKLTLEK